jgi:hypothetical protein
MRRQILIARAEYAGRVISTPHPISCNRDYPPQIMFSCLGMHGFLNNGALLEHRRKNPNSSG